MQVSVPLYAVALFPGQAPLATYTSTAFIPWNLAVGDLMSMQFAFAERFAAAPWSCLLKWLTGLSLMILLGIAAIGILQPVNNIIYTFSMVVVPLVVALAAPLFIVRGYVIEGGQLYVERPAWRTAVDLRGFNHALVDPTAMRGSWRTFGNGGLFCFAGYFRNRQLGSFRAFVTDPAKAVILSLGDRTVVVSPEQPSAMEQQLNSLGG